MWNKDDFDRVNDLLNEWDPIGVVPALKEDGVPLNEYRQYALTILGMLLRGTSETDLAKELERIAVEVIGIPVDHQRESQAAKRIFRWFDTRQHGPGGGA